VGPFALVRVHELDLDAMAPLVSAADREGHAFVRRLVEERRTGANRFDRGPAEAYFSLRDGARWAPSA
jgi:hypothetical protein